MISPYFLLISVTIWIGDVRGQVEGIYCGKQNCYDILQVTRDSDRSEIRKAYHALARTHHPDKQRTAEARQQAEIFFRSVNLAYEILSDPEQRREYDYMLDNPDEMYLNYYRYYRRQYVPHVDVRLVILVILILISTLQYIGQWTSYNEAVSYLVKDPKHRARAKQLAMDQGLLNFPKRTSTRRLTREELKDLEEELLRNLIKDSVELRGDCSKPSLGRLLIVRLILLPYTCCQWIYWYTRWVVKYWILRHPYDQEAKIYLTRRRLRLSQSNWEGLGEERQARYLDKQLWIKRNHQAYIDEQLEKSRLQAAEDSQMKRLRRYVKRHGNVPLAPMDEL